MAQVTGHLRVFQVLVFVRGLREGRSLDVSSYLVTHISLEALFRCTYLLTLTFHEIEC